MLCLQLIGVDRHVLICVFPTQTAWYSMPSCHFSLTCLNANLLTAFKNVYLLETKENERKNRTKLKLQD